jgi:hypothetical protein
VSRAGGDGDGDGDPFVGTVVTAGPAGEPHEQRIAQRIAAPAIAMVLERTSVRTPLLPIPGRSVAPAHPGNAGCADCSIVGSHRRMGTITSGQAVAGKRERTW